MPRAPAHHECIAKIEGGQRLPYAQHFYRSLPVIPQAMIDTLLSQRVTPLAIGSSANPPLKVAHGHCADDGWFEPDETGPPCIATPIDDGDGIIDVGVWNPATGQTATYWNYGFAFGQEHINAPTTYAFNGFLKVYASPLEWLRAGRGGIFVLDWSQAFDWLRDCRRIAIHEPLLTTYHEAMKPMPMPELFVITDEMEAA